jgi:hypothetical protein
MAEFEKLFISLSEIKTRILIRIEKHSNHELQTLNEILNRKYLKF